MAPLPESGDPDWSQLMENREVLAGRFELVDLPHPRRPGCSASYLNALFLNGAVLVPTYRCPQDKPALGVYRACFPDREVVPIPSEVFIQEGGAVHCLTLNEWA
jgi:agmatine deiminase